MSIIYMQAEAGYAGNGAGTQGRFKHSVLFYEERTWTIVAGREVGIIKWFDSGEGYGYIARKRGGDLYVHYSAIDCGNGDCDIEEGTAVEFTVVNSNGDSQAQNVVILD